MLPRRCSWVPHCGSSCQSNNIPTTGFSAGAISGSSCTWGISCTMSCIYYTSDPGCDGVIHYVLFSRSPCFVYYGVFIPRAETQALKRETRAHTRKPVCVETSSHTRENTRRITRGIMRARNHARKPARNLARAEYCAESLVVSSDFLANKNDVSVKDTVHRANTACHDKTNKELLLSSTSQELSPGPSRQTEASYALQARY
jgi:hypothetical protein